MISRIHALVLAAAVGCSLAACGDSTTAPDIATTTFASSLNIHLSSMTKTSDGLYYQDSIIGTGAAAAAGKKVTIAYTGWLVDGTQFDASTSYTITTLGVGQVIAGMDEGLVGVTVGGWRKLVIPPSLAYGNQAVNTIPANSILVFNVHVTAVQ